MRWLLCNSAFSLLRRNQCVQKCLIKPAKPLDVPVELSAVFIACPEKAKIGRQVNRAALNYTGISGLFSFLPALGAVFQAQEQ
jgi:hypothetical protein